MGMFQSQKRHIALEEHCAEICASLAKQALRQFTLRSLSLSSHVKASTEGTGSFANARDNNSLAHT